MASNPNWFRNVSMAAYEDMAFPNLPPVCRYAMLVLFTICSCLMQVMACCSLHQCLCLIQSQDMVERLKDSVLLYGNGFGPSGSKRGSQIPWRKYNIEVEFLSVQILVKVTSNPV